MGCFSGEWDETWFNIFVFNDPDYNTMMMSTILDFTIPEGQKEDRIVVNG